MIKRLRFYISNCHDPYINLAQEKYLLDTTEPDFCTLYLWQNQNTVVIGKNQNALAECRVELLNQEGGKLARRLSGGGAVFHDLGNLNFTFLCLTDNLDIGKQMSVIKEACRLAGIHSELSGRNDILSDSRKFSGNAFYNGGGKSYHHGTILISADTEKMQRYLSPPKAKLEAKGVKSVKSRVLNLAEISPNLTCEAMKAYLLSAFEAIYGMPADEITELDEAKISHLADKYSSWDYIYGTPLPFNISLQEHFSFGNVELQMQVNEGIVKDVKVYTDALDASLSEMIRLALISLPLKLNTISNSLFNCLPHDIAQCIISLIEKQIF